MRLVALAPLLMAAAAVGQPPEGWTPAQIPQPALERLDESVRSHVVEARAEFDQIMQGDEPAGLQAQAYGSLGKIFFAYDLLEPAEPCFLNAAVLNPQEYEWPYYLGAIYTGYSELDKAVEHLERSAELEPTYTATFIRLGRLRLDRSEPELAEDAFSRAAELDPESAAAFAGLGRVAYGAGEHELALEHFHKALELEPAANALHHRLGMTYRQLGDREKAREHLALNKHVTVGYRDPLVQGLVPLLQTAKIYFQVGIEFLQQNALEEGIAHLRISAEKDPTDHQTFYNLANAVDFSGDVVEAESLYRRTIELEPDYPDAHFNLAAMLAREGRLEEASASYRRAYELDPEDEVKHLEWATALSRSGDPERALSELERLLHRNPDYVQARINYSTLLARFGRQSEAITELRAILEREPRDPGLALTHMHLAQVLEEGGALDEAAGHYRLAVEKGPDLLEARAGLARSLARDGAFSEAADEYAFVVEGDSTDLASRFGLSLSLILAERYPEARTALEEGLETEARGLPLMHLLARLLATCPEEAVRGGARALELASEVFEKEPSIDHGETVAMALAELGRFDEAAELQRQVLSHAQTVSPSRVATIRERLSLYERGEPCRAPWRSS